MAVTINGDGTITGVSVGGLPDGIVDADMLASNAVTTAKINDSAVTTAKVNDDAVTAAKVADDAVTTAKISDSQITEAKLASDPQQGIAKAWVVFQGTSSSPGTGLDSFNVSGVTDNGTGEYTISFSNAFPSANYVVTGMVANTDDGFSSSVAGATRGCSGVHIQGTVAPTASQFNIQTRFGSTSGSNGGADDFSRVYIAVFGD